MCCSRKMGFAYVVPTLHEEPPDLFGVGVPRGWLRKSFHGSRFSAINFYVGRGCAASGVIGIGTTYVGDLYLHKLCQDGGLQAGSGHL